MILILSQNDDDSTNEVIDWLIHFGVRFLRINGSDFENKSRFTISLTKEQNSLAISAKEIQDIFVKYNFTSVWFRRWSNKDFFRLINPRLDRDQIVLHQIGSHLNREFGALRQIIFSQAFSKNNKSFVINHPQNNPPKMEMLIAAREIGLTIPETIITNNKCELEKFISEHTKVITKAIGEISPLIFRREMYTQYTTVLGKDSLSDIPDTFFPSLFQNAIEKEYEVRVFYLDNELYSMAIFSQQTTRTSYDFRNMDFENPVRLVPYNLPIPLRNRLKRLMRTLKLNSGSIDMIKSTNGRYYFLEVNPVGQFGMVSFPCNYYLEKKIAERLMKNEKESKTR